MAKLKLNLTDDIIKLMSNFRIQKLNQLNVKQNPEDWTDKYFGIDTYGLYHGSYLYQDMAEILGLSDKIIKGTELDYDGPKYEQETMNYLIDLDAFIVSNILNLEEIIHQFATKGGVKSGIYTCRDNEHIWSFANAIEVEK